MSERMMKIIPSMKIIASVLLNDSRYVIPVITAMLDATSAKKVFSPIPGAITNGLFARKAMHNEPIADAMQVARKTPFQRSWPLAPKPVRIFGFKAMI